MANVMTTEHIDFEIVLQACVGTYLSTTLGWIYKRYTPY